jgi:hypothetical protein
LTYSSRPNQPTRLVNVGSSVSSVKIPELYNIALNNDVVPESVLEFILFEQISGQELLSISRTDLLNGQNPDYGVIGNLADVSSDYSPSNILSLPGLLPNLFKVFGIVLENHIPTVEISENDEVSRLGNESPNSYVDIDDSSNTKNFLILEFKNMQQNYDVEVQVLSYGIQEDTVV